MPTLGEPFAARCRKSETTVEVAADQTLLQALLDEGISVDYSCEGGVCGTCVLPLLSGEVIHEDEFLTEDEREERGAFPGRGRRRVEARVGVQTAVELVDVARWRPAPLLQQRLRLALALFLVLDVGRHGGGR